MDIYSEKKAMKDLNSLYAEAVYGKPKSAGQELASREKRDDAAGAPKKMIVTRADKKANTPAYQNYKKGVKGYAAADHLKNEEYGELYSTVYSEGEKRWQDDDGDGKWYEKSDVDGKISKREKKAKKHDCASKVKHEQFGIGNPVKGMHDLDESGKVAHYDVLFEHGIEKNIPVSSLEILEGHMHEHVIREGKKNCGCGQDPCITYGKGKNAHKMPDGTVMPGKTHKEEVSNWRDDLSEVLTATEKEVDKEVKETKVKNKVIIDPEVKLEQALGGKVESIQEEECEECGSEEHTTEEHELSVKEEILLDRAVVALSEMNIDEDIADIIARLEKKRISKGGNPDDSPLPAMKKYHADKKKKAAKTEK